MKKYLRLYWLFIKYSFMTAMMYKEDFIIWSLVNIGWFVLNISFYHILFSNVSEIAGWTKPQILLIQGFYFIFDFFMWGTLWENMWQIPRKINTGTLDLELVKPINLQFLLSFKHISADNANSVLLAIITIAYALRLGHIQPSAQFVFLASLAVVIAAVYIYAAWFATMCIAFWFDRFDNLQYLFPSLRHFWKVPQPFYKGLLKGILTFVIPITLVTTVPAQFLLHQPSFFFLAFLFLSAIIMLKFSHWFLSIAIKHYSSASS